MTLQFSSTDIAANVVSGVLSENFKVELGNEPEFVSTLLWLSLLCFGVRYYQVNIEIEGQYRYLHALEAELNQFYLGSKVFTREGVGYLERHSTFHSWVWLLYTLIFPVGFIICMCARFRTQRADLTIIDVNYWIDFGCFSVLMISTALYLWSLHEARVRSFVSEKIVALRAVRGGGNGE